MSEQSYNTLPEDQFSFKDIVLKLVNFKNLIVKNWKIIVLSIIIGLVSGFVFELLTKKKPVYIAKIIFNMENGATAGGGGLSELASSLGFGGGGQANNGLFSGENFIELLKTKKLYNRAVLSKVKVNGKDEIFGNYYLKKSGILEDEEDDSEELKTFKFKHDNYEKSTQAEKSTVRLVQSYLMSATVVGADSKKASFLSLTVTTRNDTLSYIWSNLYLNIVTDFYKETKTQKTRELLVLIEHRVDSLKRELYRTQNAAARFTDQNQQIIVQEGLVNQQRLQTNSTQLQSLYFEAVRNLDNLRFSMAKETPLFTRIDDPELPISSEPDPLKNGLIIGSILGLVLGILYVAVRETLKEIKYNLANQ